MTDRWEERYIDLHGWLFFLMVNYVVGRLYGNTIDGSSKDHVSCFWWEVFSVKRTDEQFKHET